MISINDYIDNILSDFEAYIESSDCLCELHDLRFDGGHIPDYSNLPVQQLYLLRYAYGYAFEYKQMFQSMAPQKWATDTLVLTSIGCGTMLDYWAARKILDNAGRSDLPVRYTGIDLLDWQYKMPCAPGDTTNYLVGDAIAYLRGKSVWDDDVFIFPKSISEFSDREFQELCNIFGAADYTKRHFCVMANVRADEYNRKQDVARVTELANAITDAGFFTQSPCDKYWKAKDPEKKIRETDVEFQHPQEVVELLCSLNEQCKCLNDCGKDQQLCKDRLTWWPILNQRQLAYQILYFARK